MQFFTPTMIFLCTNSHSMNNTITSLPSLNKVEICATLYTHFNKTPRIQLIRSNAIT